MKKQRTPQAIVKKSVGAIHIEAKLSLVERKLSNALLFNAYENLLLNKQHSIDIKTMSALIGFESKNTSELKGAIEKLVSTTIKWNIFDEKGEEEWEIASLLAYAKIKNGICTYEYSSALAEKFYNPEIYARINLSIQKNIASGHTLALYEMCVRFLGVGSTGWVSVEKFRRVMGVYEDKYYGEFKNLNRRIIKSSVEEINKSTNIFVVVEYRKVNKVVTDVRFLVKENPQLTLLEMEEDDEISVSHAYKRLLEKGVSKMIARQWVLEHGEAYVLEKLEVTEHAKAAGKLKSVSGFLSKAIADNYTNAEVNEKKAISEAKKKRELKASLERKIERLRADILKIERANRHERGRIVEAHIALLTKEDEGRLGDEYAASLTNEFNRADFLKKRWASLINEASIVLFVGTRYGLEYPLSDDTARALELPTISALNAAIGQLHGEIKKNG